MRQVDAWLSDVSNYRDYVFDGKLEASDLFAEIVPPSGFRMDPYVGGVYRDWRALGSFSANANMSGVGRSCIIFVDLSLDTGDAFGRISRQDREAIDRGELELVRILVGCDQS